MAEQIACDVCGKMLSPRSQLEQAAPAMLEALEGLVEAVVAEVNEKGGGGYILARLTDARAAIAAATGEERGNG